MAHSCPDCGSACYCGGDIDDCLIPDDEQEANCTCCEDADDAAEREYDDIDDGYYPNEEDL